MTSVTRAGAAPSSRALTTGTEGAPHPAHSRLVDPEESSENLCAPAGHPKLLGSTPWRATKLSQSSARHHGQQHQQSMMEQAPKQSWKIWTQALLCGLRPIPGPSALSACFPGSACGLGERATGAERKAKDGTFSPGLTPTREAPRVQSRRAGQGAAVARVGMRMCARLGGPGSGRQWQPWSRLGGPACWAPRDRAD